MVIPVDEGQLLTVAGLIFIPLFIFLMKMIMEQANNKARIESFEKHIADTKDHPTEMTSFRLDIEHLKERIQHIEAEINHLFRRQDRNRDMKKGEGDSTGGF